MRCDDHTEYHTSLAGCRPHCPRFDVFFMPTSDNRPLSPPTSALLLPARSLPPCVTVERLSKQSRSMIARTVRAVPQFRPSKAAAALTAIRGCAHLRRRRALPDAPRLPRHQRHLRALALTGRSTRTRPQHAGARRPRKHTNLAMPTEAVALRWPGYAGELRRQPDRHSTFRVGPRSGARRRCTASVLPSPPHAEAPPALRGAADRGGVRRGLRWTLELSLPENRKDRVLSLTR